MATSDPSQEQTSQQIPHRPAEMDKYVDEFLSLVCDTSRRYILELLSISNESDGTALPEKRSGDIARAIGLSAATTSEHLRQLANAGLLASRREGNTVYYRLQNHLLIAEFHGLLNALYKEYSARTPEM
jgi:DNA-binding transcriptional ArsR family regulator